MWSRPTLTVVHCTVGETLRTVSTVRGDYHLVVSIGYMSFLKSEDRKDSGDQPGNSSKYRRLN